MPTFISLITGRDGNKLAITTSELIFKGEKWRGRKVTRSCTKKKKHGKHPISGDRGKCATNPTSCIKWTRPTAQNNRVTDIFSFTWFICKQLVPNTEVKLLLQECASVRYPISVIRTAYLFTDTKSKNSKKHTDKDTALFAKCYLHCS